MIARFGHWCFVHRRVTLGSWLVGMVMIFAIGNVVGSGFDGSQNPPDSETSDGFDVLDRYFGGLGTGITGAIVFEADAGVSSPDVQSAMTDMFTAADALDEVTRARPLPGTRWRAEYERDDRIRRGDPRRVHRRSGVGGHR